MKYTIRECDIKDAEYIYKLNVEEMGYEYPLEKTKENIVKLLNSNNDKIFVAEVEEWAKKTDAGEIRLVSGERRVDTHIFYEKCGYIKDSQKISLKKNV